MDSIYDIDLYNPIKDDLERFKQDFVLAPELWTKFTISDLVGVDFSKWETIKLMNDGEFSDKLSDIPTDCGGIYVYCIEPQIIPNVGIYIMYIGKATKTEHENLQKRVRSYRSCITNDEMRPRLHRLFEKWGEYVYVHYLPVQGLPEVITALEDRLIAAFGKPPCNADVRMKSVKKAVRAFN